MSFLKFLTFLSPALAPTTAAAPPTRPGHDEAPLALLNAANGQACEVVAVQAPAGAPDWGRWLAEIGFVPGEPATVTARSPWGDGALVVRIGASTFALRRTEAACVQVRAL